MPVRVTFEQADFLALVSGQVVQKYFVDQGDRRLVSIQLEAELTFPMLQGILTHARNEKSMADGAAAAVGRLPATADLDKVAQEQKIADATAGPERKK
jgi:hypothetical protein